MKKITKSLTILASLLAALGIALGVPATSATATAEPTTITVVTTYFTAEETAFIYHVEGLGITGVTDQELVDIGWSIVYNLQQGYTPDQIAANLLVASHRGQGGNGITWNQARMEVHWAIMDLDGTSPSPGGAYTGPDTSNSTLR